jgi:two-component system sensor histidine kinase KdpD
LFAALLGVVAAAAIGGVGPAAVAIVAGFLTADFFFTLPYYSLRVDHVIDVLALLAFAAVGGGVGVLVDVLTRQGLRVAGARTEADGIARLAAETIGLTPDALPRVAESLRSTFGLDGVAVLRRAGGDWRPDFVLGEPIPPRPDEATYNAELSDGQVLVLMTSPGRERDAQLLRSFVDTLRLRRERDQLKRL